MSDLFVTPAFSRFLQSVQPLYDFLPFGISSLCALCISTLFSINLSAFSSSSKQYFLFLFSLVGEYLLNPNEASNRYCDLQHMKESDTDSLYEFLFRIGQSNHHPSSLRFLPWIFSFSMSSDCSWFAQNLCGVQEWCQLQSFTKYHQNREIFQHHQEWCRNWRNCQGPKPT